MQLAVKYINDFDILPGTEINIDVVDHQLLAPVIFFSYFSFPKKQQMNSLLIELGCSKLFI